MAESTEFIDVDSIYQRHPFVKAALQQIEDAGYEAVLVGGIVRDALRAKLEPNYRFEALEVDIATSADPKQIKEIFPHLSIIEVGEAFGVLVVRSPDGQNYEIATYRTESDYDGRKPGAVQHVRELEKDIQRRDFTVNGLAATKDGFVIDHVGGIPDLKDKIIRTVGDADERFKDDYLRLLRAVRFSCKLDASMDEKTLNSIRSHAPKIEKISQERIKSEIVGILESSRSAWGIELMDELGLLEVILPELIECKDVPQPEKYHPEGDVFVHTILALKIADGFIKDPLVKLAVLLHDIGKPLALEANEGVNMAGHDKIGAKIAKNICRRMRFSNSDTLLVELLIAEHQRIGHFSQMSRSKQVQFIKNLGNASFEVSVFIDSKSRLAKLIQLMIADSQASAMKSRGWLSVIRSIQPLLNHMHELEEETKAHELITGHDLIELGYEQGPKVGDALDAIYEAIYGGDVKFRDQALTLAKQLLEEQEI